MGAYPAEPNDILWVHDGCVDAYTLSRNEITAIHSDFWDGYHDSCGRIDAAAKIGSMRLSADIGRKKARRIVEDVIAAFPGIKFRVLHGFGYDYRETSMQLFWEATE